MKSITPKEYRELIAKQKKSKKYRNTVVEYDGNTFDSIKERDYYIELKLKQKAGIVKDIFCQVPILIEVNCIKICKYYCDFKIIYSDKSIEYVDIKAFDKKNNKYITTPAFQLKKKLVKAVHGIDIKIV